MDQRICEAPDCRKHAANRRMCWMHYTRLRRHGTLDARATSTLCKSCGVEFPVVGKSGTFPQFCGNRCWSYWQRHGAPRPPSPTICVNCGGPLSGAQSRFCGRDCVSFHFRHGGPRPSHAVCRTCDDLIDLTERDPAGRLLRRTTTVQCDECKATKQRPKRPALSVTALAIRDGVRCRWCGDDVDMSLRSPHPLSPTADHVVPWARGGRNEADNLQLLHRHCNVMKAVSPMPS